MKEDKIGTCDKCGIKFYIDTHHILPKAFFGRKGKTVNLCPNCHQHFHNYSRKNTQNPNDIEEAKSIWETWYTSVSTILYNMETTTKPFTISNLIDTYSRIYAQLAKENVSVIEEEMRKIAPSDSSEVLIMAGANFTDNQIGVSLFISNPLPVEQTQTLNFVEILQQCILKADISKLKTMYECADFLENSWGKYYFVDAVPIHYNQELDKYSFDFFIFKEKRRTKV